MIIRSSSQRQAAPLQRNSDPTTRPLRIIVYCSVDIHTIALWLGHESTKSTEPYLHADNKLKQRAIERIAPTGTRPGRYRPSDRVMAFLEGL